MSGISGLERIYYILEGGLESSSVVERLPGLSKALGSTHSTKERERERSGGREGKKPGVVVRT